MQFDQSRTTCMKRRVKFAECIVQHEFVSQITVGGVLLLRLVYVHGHQRPCGYRSSERRMISDPEIPFVPEELHGGHVLQSTAMRVPGVP